jgi:ankyrin repeat protein
LAIAIAADKGYTDLVKMLLEEGADASVVDEVPSVKLLHLLTVLKVYSGPSFKPLFEKLLLCFHWTIPQDQLSALHWAARSGHLEIVKLFLERGINASIGAKVSCTVE